MEPLGAFKGLRGPIRALKVCRISRESWKGPGRKPGAQNRGGTGALQGLVKARIRFFRTL